MIYVFTEGLPIARETGHRKTVVTKHCPCPSGPHSLARREYKESSANYQEHQKGRAVGVRLGSASSLSAF